MKIYNTLTKKKDSLRQKENKKINLFVCGPTVYDYSHLGHAKTYTQFDFIVRYLRYKSFEVFYLQNITDIDDKIIKRAKETKTTWKKVARKFEKLYLQDMRSLHNTSVTKYARATDYINKIIDQIETLVKKGFAYKINDGYYFEVSKFNNYGKLSGRTDFSEDDSISRIDENSEKRGWNDFCLWKFSKSNEPSWNSPLGDGRPGWHIEDTAITESEFGPQYDIHGGAVDLVIPHHEAEVAQMESSSGKSPFVKYWMHTGFLKINNEKMSKSKGNFTTIRDVLKKYDYKILRFLFLSSHYRSRLEFSEESLTQAENSLKRIDEFLFNLERNCNDKDESSEQLNKLKEKVIDALDNDFNTPSAISYIFDYIKKRNQSKKMGTSSELKYFKELNSIFDFMKFDGEKDGVDVIGKLVKKRDVYRNRGDFKNADVIRDKLLKMGIKIYDKDSGTVWRKIKQ